MSAYNPPNSKRVARRLIGELEIDDLMKVYEVMKEKIKKSGKLEVDGLNILEKGLIESVFGELPSEITNSHLGMIEKFLQGLRRGKEPFSESKNSAGSDDSNYGSGKDQGFSFRMNQQNLRDEKLNHFEQSLGFEEFVRLIKKIDPKIYPSNVLPLYVLYTKGKLNRKELTEECKRLAREQGLSESSAKRAVSEILRNRLFVNIYVIDGEEFFELSSSLKNDIRFYLSKEKETEGDISDAIEDMTKEFLDFFRRYTTDRGERVYIEKLADLLTVRFTKSLEVDYVHLAAFSPKIATSLLHNPDETILAAERAVQVILQEDFFRKDSLPIHVRFYNLPRTLTIREVGSWHISKFIQIEGIVSRQLEHKPFVSRAVYVCKDCGQEMIRLQKPYAALVKPDKCEACGSRNIELDVDKSTFTDVQYFRVQDLPDAMVGASARFIDAIVLDDLVDAFLPGDRVKVTGILRVILEHKSGPPIFKKILEVNHVDVVTKRIVDVEISKSEEEEIKKLARREDIVDLIVRSIAPSIHGYYEIKKGIALALFSGGDWIAPDGTVTRGHSHVLIIGDPGTAKSTISRFLRQIIPRGIWTTAKTSSAAGLTASAVKDEVTGSWVIEAGALVLSNGGICVIDEFDKMDDKDRVAIHEALEHGTISVSKAGMNVTLPAKATVIAIGNPKGGRFNPMKKFHEQIDFPPTLLSRFDLIFVLVDEPDVVRDDAIANHVLRYKLTGKKASEIEFIPPDLLRKYLAYARQNYEPELSDEAAELLKNYYVRVRNQIFISDDGTRPIPITARQLEGLVRLAKARARMRLSDVITREDVEDVIKLMEWSLRKIALDEAGNLDVLIIEVGKSVEEMTKEEKLLSIIKRLQDMTEWGAPKDELIREAFRVGIVRGEVEEILKDLKINGRIYEPRDDYYKLA